MPTRQAVFTVFGIATIATLCVLPNLMLQDSSTGVDSYFEEARSFQRRFLDDDDSNCTHHHNTCEQVRANCQLGTGGTALFNYYEFYYCTTSSSKWIGFTVLILWLLIVFSLLASTADSFFVVQLETMSEKLRLSPTVAGITLCAVGNSAPDVFSDLAAVQNANDFSLALGELMGASMFLTTCVLGAVILVATSKDNDHANVNGVDFVRDVTIFSIALGLLLIFTLTEQKIYLYESLMIIGVYLLYIAVVVSMSYWKTPSTDLHHMNTMPPDVGLMKNKNNNETKRNTQTNTTLTDSLLEAGENIDESNEEEDEDDDSRMYGLDWSSEDSVFEKLTFVVEFPFSVMRWLSIASANTSHWDWRRRYLACFAPIGTVIVVFLDFSGNWQSGTSWDGFREPKIAGHVPVVYIFILAAALIGVLIFMTTNNTEIPSYHWALVLLAFISTVAWLDMIGNECVAVLEALGTITSITSTSEGHSIMGITVLAWANSIGDFVADTAIARSGKVKMAIASTFGSPLLTACLGLGLATVVAASSNSNHSVQSKMDGELWISYIFLALSMGSSLTLISSKGFRVPRWYAFYLFGLYSMYVLFSVLHCTKVI